MDGEKRKRRDDGDDEGKRRKPESEEKTLTVTEDEVEEFYAILKRIQVAAKYLGKRNGADRGLTFPGRWPGPLEDSEDLKGEVEDGDKDQSKKEEDSAENDTGLDLNLEPPSKENTV